MRLQRTLKGTVLLEGKSIHSGDKVRVAMKKAPVDTGIVFIRTDLKDSPAISADVSNLASYSGDLRCTSIEKDGASVNTIEHLMAALSNLNVDNARVEIDNQELPALDGSALEYVLELQKAGGVEQDGKKRELLLEDVLCCRDGDAALVAIPSENFSVSYLLKYDGADYMTQCANFTFDSVEKKEEIFTKEIAPARTFCMEREVAYILEKGLGKGGDYNNALILRATDGSPIQNEFRFPNELARHKIIDLLGDLALLNLDLKTHIIGIRSGHSLNRELLRKLAKLFYRYRRTKDEKRGASCPSS